MTDLAFASATTAAQAIHQGATTAVALTEQLLDRIAAHNPALNALVNVDSAGALDRARAADAAAAQGDWWGPLHGVPITIKDAFRVAGLPTTAGAPFLADHVPDHDAVIVARLRDAGATIVGNSNVPFMLGDHQSDNEIYGRSNNPWDLARTPGGSTGGGAAAVAAGLSYLSLGSDIGGSIRLPAHFSGVYGHKPSLNIVPLRGHIPPPPGASPQPPSNLAVAGPLARSAADLHLALSLIAGPDTPESQAYAFTLPPARHQQLTNFRIGYVLDHPRCPVGSDVAAPLAAAVSALKEAGAQVSQGWPAGVDPTAQFETYLYLLDAVFAFQLDESRLEKLCTLAAGTGRDRAAIRARAWTDPHKAFQAAERRRMRAREAWQTYFETHDAFLLPTTFVPAFRLDPRPWGERTLETPEGVRSDYNDILFWISFATLAGLPATTAPVGLTPAGLPVGLQIVGPLYEDATPIAVAGHLANLNGGFQPPPGYAAR